MAERKDHCVKLDHGVFPLSYLINEQKHIKIKQIITKQCQQPQNKERSIIPYFHLKTYWPKDQEQLDWSNVTASEITRRKEVNELNQENLMISLDLKRSGLREMKRQPWEKLRKIPQKIIALVYNHGSQGLWQTGEKTELQSRDLLQLVQLMGFRRGCQAHVLGKGNLRYWCFPICFR